MSEKPATPKPAIPKLKFDSAIANLESPDTVSIFARDEDSFLHEIVVPKDRWRDAPIHVNEQPCK